MIKAGAFDRLGHPRKGLLGVFEQIIDMTLVRRRERDQGVMSLFGDWGADAEDGNGTSFDERIAIPQIEFDKTQRLRFEKEMLGLYVSDHPLAGLEIPLAKHASTSIHDLLASEDVADGDQVTVAGLLTSVQHRVAKSSGNPYGMITIEDFDGEVTVMFMGKTYTEFQSMLQADSILVVRGRVSRRDDGLNLHAQSAFAPDLGALDASGPLVLVMPEHRATESVVGELAEVLERHRGDTEVTLRLHKGSTAKVFEVPIPVQVTADLYGELKGLLGPQCLG